MEKGGLKILLRNLRKINKEEQQNKTLDLTNFSSSCNCGKYTECCREIRSNSNGKLWIETDEHFKCGKVQEQLLKMKNWWNENYH